MLLGLLFVRPALALESAPVTSPRTTVTLVSDVDAIAPGQPFHLGLRMRLAPGWHTYGRDPGDAGVPTELALDLPQGAKASGIDWPPAQRFAEGPLVTYGYTGDVLLPVTVTAPGKLAVTAHANWLVCKEICVPEEGVFRLDLPAGTPTPSAQAALFAAPAPAAAADAGPPFGRVLGLAFLGGLILNLMPCVFPILAMKAASLAGGAARGEVRAHAAFYSAGVVLAFAALGGVLLGLRAAGGAAGWGFQFQSPIFVAAMAWLLFVVGLNLSGVFEIGGRLAGAGHGLATRGGHLGSFCTGLLAVLVATPCTAPFMGIAIAAALAAPPVLALLVFLVMGIGLATPTLLLAAIPGVARVAPRPGRWMLILKQVLAFPMYAAAAWLVWVMSQEAGPSGVLATLAGLVLLGFAAWAFGASHHRTGIGAQLARIAALAACVGAAVVLSEIGTAPPPGVAEARAEDGVEPFTTARLAALRAEGRPVFVNMTAAWCVTCLVNERVAISTAPVRAAFAARDVAYLKGDWTRQDPEITAFLRAHGRDGVPLYVYFPPGNAQPIVLPQILTVGALLDEVGRARS
ncbi:MAG: thioredoxin family protein [Alphaproteobacteria bacterium]|nr:thioredoxin family protein [Alphaproteobacteria bacterium]